MDALAELMPVLQNKQRPMRARTLEEDL